MSTPPPKAKLRRERPTDKFTVTRNQLERIVEVERWLDRANFFVPLTLDMETPRTYWGRIVKGVVLGGITDNLSRELHAPEPRALSSLDPSAREQAFAPPPEILPATDKVWAGSMQSFRIAQAMLAAIADAALHNEKLLDHGQVVAAPNDPTDKVEPFYFDARRASNAHSRDVGFAPTLPASASRLRCRTMERWRMRRRRRTHSVSARAAPSTSIASAPSVMSAATVRRSRRARRPRAADAGRSVHLHPLPPTVQPWPGRRRPSRVAAVAVAAVSSLGRRRRTPPDG
jgi:hypothetical protein